MLLKTWGLTSTFKAATLHNALKSVQAPILILYLHVFFFLSVSFTLKMLLLVAFVARL